jgi:hypothetical protein
MQLTVNGIKRKISADLSEKLEQQYDELVKSLEKINLTVFSWVEKCDGDKSRVATVLKMSNFNYLATEVGVEFLFSKVPCPVGH